VLLVDDEDFGRVSILVHYNTVLIGDMFISGLFKENKPCNMPVKISPDQPIKLGKLRMTDNKVLKLNRPEQNDPLQEVLL
jgi:hypothetical protein